MRPIEIGLVLPMGDSFVDGSTARWLDIRDLAVRAEELGFDTNLELVIWPPTTGALDALAPVIEMLDTD